MLGFVARHSSLLPNSESKYSREGTDAHEHAKNCLLLGVCESSMFPSKEMYRHVKGYVDIIEGWKKTPSSVFYVEEKLALFYDETNEGTTDAAVAELLGKKVKRVFIGDLKYGAGVSVQAKRNPQITIYGLNFILKLMNEGYEIDDDTLIILMIYQPRVLGEQAVRLWSVSFADLYAYGEEIGAVATAIIANPNSGVFSPDDKTCQFCHAASICTARAGQLLGVTPKTTQTELLGPPPAQAFPAPETLSTDQLSRIVRVAPKLREWLTKCESFGAGLLHNGKPFKGFKLVERRSNRKWGNFPDSEIASTLTMLGADATDIWTERELVSPHQAEELLKELGQLDAETKELLSAFVIKPPGSAILVPSDDPRQEYDADPVADFKPVASSSSLLE